MSHSSFLLYGAYGYTGKLIARFAESYGLRPLLAGRNEARLREMAAETGFDYRVVSLDNQAATDRVLQEVPVVLHCAGPFMYTAHPMMEACLRNGVHYLDITGEIEVFELGHSLDQAAKAAGIMLMSGTGFDVVPTDCLALHLKEQLPDATHLELAFVNEGGSLSHGTAKTMVENLGKPGAERINGVICEVPIGKHTRYIPGKQHPLFVMSIPWGDVSTAFYSTGIPNIITYTGIRPSAYKYVKWQPYVSGLLRNKWVRGLIRRQIDARPAGPSDAMREKAQTLVWGEVRNDAGKVVQAQLQTPEGYTLTTHASLIIVGQVLSGNHPIGFQTPAAAYGSGLVEKVEGVHYMEG